MILKSGSFKQMAWQINQSKKGIIVFGAGLIGTVTIPAILEEYGVEDQISFYVDSDSNKQGETIFVNNRMYDIFGIDRLNHIDADSVVMLLAVSRFSDVLLQLKSLENLKNVICYIVPMMCISNFRPVEKEMVKRESGKEMIPKVIHYMWLGEKAVPDKLKYCIDSWYKHCPDYEICCWNENNYDICKNEYMKQAYEHGMYGFVPDYARLDILYNCGGIYLDTDVELVKGLDDLLYQEAFCCVEKWQTINFGGGSGAVKGNTAIGELIKARENLQFVDRHGNFNKTTCGYYDTRTLQKYGYRINGKVQKVLDINIYPYEFFHPYDYMSGKIERSRNTHGIHHFNGGWLDEEMREANRKTSEEFEMICNGIESSVNC